ncbi:MAG: MFS transporter, partial [Actinomycetota bacterium]
MTTRDLAPSTGGRSRVRSGGNLPRAVSFWSLATLLMFFLFAASAPSPLYADYLARFHFSQITLTEIYA